MPPKEISRLPIIEPDHLLAQPKKRASAGPIIGIIVIVIVMLFGALYFWGARLNTQDQYNNLPLIPADSTSAAR